MTNLQRLNSWLFPDRRPDWEKDRERDFIAALNGLKTLSTTARGGMSIDPEEIRELIVASREQLKHLVHKPGAPSRPFKAVATSMWNRWRNPPLRLPWMLWTVLR